MRMSLAMIVSVSTVAANLASAQEPRCRVSSDIIGDGWCDWDVTGANTAECDWDGGDCCESTCGECFDFSGSERMCYKCGSHQYSCLDPQVESDFVRIYPIAGTEGSWDGGIDSPFSHYQSSASLVSTEDFSGLSQRGLGPLCSYERNKTVDIDSDCIAFPVGVSASGSYLSLAQPMLGGEKQTTPCAPFFNFTFDEDVRVTTVHLQMYLTNDLANFNFTSLLGHEAYVMSRMLPLVVDSQYTNDALTTFYETQHMQDGAEFAEVGIMSVKGSKITQLQIGSDPIGDGAFLVKDEKTLPRYCINTMTLYTGNGDPASQAQPAMSSAPPTLYATSLATTAAAVAVAILSMAM